jgi:hypothetical protein
LNCVEEIPAEASIGKPEEKHQSRGRAVSDT